MSQERFNTVTLSQSGTSDWIFTGVLTDGRRGHPYSLSVEITGTATATVEMSVDPDRLQTPVSHTLLTDITSSVSCGIFSPIAAFRLNVSSLASGSVTLSILQSHR